MSGLSDSDSRTCIFASIDLLDADLAADAAIETNFDGRGAVWAGPETTVRFSRFAALAAGGISG
jgi:hypothetical protein